MEYTIYSGKSPQPKEYKYVGKTPHTIQMHAIVNNLRGQGDNVLVLTSQPNIPTYATHYLAYRMPKKGGGQ